MNDSLWIVVGLVLVFFITGALAIRGLVRKSREQEKKIDYTKVRRWSEDD